MGFRSALTLSSILIPDGRLQPGALHTISMAGTEMPGLYRMEIQSIAGNGKLSVAGPLPR